MKKHICAWGIIIAAIIYSPAAAAIDTSSLTRALPDEAMEYVQISPDKADAKKGIGGIAKGLMRLFKKGLRSSLAEGFTILAIGALSGILVLFRGSAGSDTLVKAIEVTAICAVGILCLSGASGVLEACAASLERLSRFSAALLPVYAAAVAVSGSPLAAVATSSATLIFSNIMVFMASRVLIPAIYLHILLSVVGRVAENDLLLGAATMFRKACLSFFRYFLMLYTGYVTMSGLISAGTDAVTLKTAKVTITGSVPVLGSIISDVSEALLSGAVILKNSVGVYGFIGVLAICLAPFAAAAARMAVFKILTLVTSAMCGGMLAKLLDNISDSYNVALGLLGTCCAIQFLSFVICSVVIKT